MSMFTKMKLKLERNLSTFRIWAWLVLGAFAKAMDFDCAKSIDWFHGSQVESIGSIFPAQVESDCPKEKSRQGCRDAHVSSRWKTTCLHKHHDGLVCHSFGATQHATDQLLMHRRSCFESEHF